MNFLKQLGRAVCHGVRRICGTTKAVFKLFGIPLLTVTERDSHHFNVFFLFVPLLQIVTGPRAHMINILLLAWFLKLIKYLFTGWSFIDQAEITRFTFCSRTIYEKRIIEPYQFLSTTFRDKQVSG